MSAQPLYFSIPHVDAGIVPATLDTSLTAPTNATSIFEGAATGSKIEEITFLGLGTTVAGLVHVFLHDGTTYHIRDSVIVAANTVSATAVPVNYVRMYSNLWLPDDNWSIRVTTTIAGNQSMLKCIAFGADA